MHCTTARAVHVQCVHFFLKNDFLIFFPNSQQKKLLLITHFLNETGAVYLQRLWHSVNNMFGFHECELAIQKYKNIKTDTLCVTLD